MIKIILTIGMSIKIVREISNLARIITFMSEAPIDIDDKTENSEVLKAIIKRNKIKMLVESILSCLLLLAVFAWMSCVNI